MTREETIDDRFVSRRTTIRAGVIGGFATIGLSGLAAAHDDDSDDQEADDTDANEQESDDQEPDEEEPDEQESDEQESDEEEPDEQESDEEEPDDQESDGEEPDEQESDDADQSASVSISEHETGGGSVTVDEVHMSDGGFVSIHDRRRFDGQILGSIIGITEFLEPGTHNGVSVPLFTQHATAGPAQGQNQNGLTESQPLVAIPHLDGNDSGVFDGDPDPAYQNGPRTLTEFQAVNDIATVFVEGADQDERDAATDEEAQARQQFS